jgi:Tfp pilus assembly protein PilO
VTTRDRIILVVIALVGLVGGFWYLALTPKRDEAKDLSTKIGQAQQSLDAARRSQAEATTAKARYDADYAAVARLGKAVPVDDRVPSLMYQLQTAAHGANVNFLALKATGSVSSSTTTSGVGAVAAAGSAVKTNGATDPSAPTSAPATQAAAVALPPGATVGPAGFPTMPFSFSFQGRYGDLRRFLAGVQRLVRVDGKDVRVNGRLMTIDAFAMSAGDGGFPQVKATLSATTYLLPADQGLTAGATPAGPAGATTAAPTSTALVSGAK